MYILGKYEVLHELGRGGMGIVYKAKDTRLGRIVAIKELVLGHGIKEEDKPNLIERFHREAQAAANINNQYIITIYDIGEENGHHYIAMEYVEGQTLKQVLKLKTDLPFSFIINIFIQVCDALDYAHNKGIVHRDIKPDNIIITKKGTVKITDFGVARMSHQLSTMTADGTMLGTLGYMSPEQLADARSVDGRSDIFSVGAILYEMYTQTPPFADETVGMTIMKILSQEPVPPKQINPEIPDDLEKIIMKALQKKPDMRYQKAKEMSVELESLLKKDKKNLNLCPNCQHPISANVKFCSNCGTPVKIEEEAPPVQNAEPAQQSYSDKLQEQLLQMRSFGQLKEKITSSLKPPDEEENDPFQLLNDSQDIIKGEEPERREAIIPADSADFFYQFRLLFHKIIGKGSAKGQFSSPKAFAFTPKGSIYVLDPQNLRIQVFDKFGEWQFLIPLNQGKEAMRSPVSMSIDTRGRIYILDSLDCKVKILDSYGSFISEFGSKGQSRGQFNNPACIALSNANEVYVADTENYRIQVLDAGGQAMKMIGKYGVKAGEFKSPCSIAVDENERMYCLDYGFPRIQMLDKNGITRLIFGKRGVGNGEFSVPKGIAIDKKKRIYVADTLNHRIQIFDERGNFLLFHGSKGVSEGQFIGPEALYINNDGELFVLDKGNNRVQVFKILNF